MTARPRTYISLYKLTPNSCDANVFNKKYTWVSQNGKRRRAQRQMAAASAPGPGLTLSLLLPKGLWHTRGFLLCCRLRPIALRICGFVGTNHLMMTRRGACGAAGEAISTSMPIRQCQALRACNGSKAQHHFRPKQTLLMQNTSSPCRGLFKTSTTTYGTTAWNHGK